MLSVGGPQTVANGVSLIGEVGDVTVGEVGPSHSTEQSQGNVGDALCPEPTLTSLQSQEMEVVSTAE